MCPGVHQQEQPTLWSSLYYPPILECLTVVPVAENSNRLELPFKKHISNFFLLRYKEGLAYLLYDTHLVKALAQVAVDFH